MANQIRGVLYLQRDKFLLSIDSRVDILTYVFPPNMVSNLDILDTDGLKLNLNEFIRQNKIAMTSLVIVLSNAVIFEQDFKTEDEPKIPDFLDNVPYETISIKKIPIQGGTKVLIGNATFYTLLADVFKQNGTVLDYVIPEKALGASIGSFNASTARLILTQFETLSQYKFVVDESTETQAEFKLPEKKKIVVHKKNYTLLYTIPVFALLLLILLFMILQPIIFKQKTNTVSLASTIPTIIPATVAPTLLPTAPLPSSSTSSAIVQPKLSSAHIIYDPSSAQKAEQLRTILTTLGVTNVQVTSSPSDITAPILLISAVLDPTEKKKVVDAVKSIIPTVVAEDSSSQPVDVTITLGKTQ
jgi:hypothetical protein